MSARNRKGITPVIAIVLLILVTFVAIGAVAGLVDQLTDVGIGDDFLDQQEAEATDVSFEAVYANDHDNTADGAEAVALSVRNTGSRDIDVSEELELRYGPDGEEPLAWENFETVFDDWVVEDFEYEDYECFAEDADTVIAPDETYECELTASRFPGGVESITLELNLVGFDDEAYTYDCDPATSDSATC